MPDDAGAESDVVEAVEAAVFRRLLSHLGNRSDVQNIDLMLLAEFCRNCLSEWYLDAAEQRGWSLSEDEAKQRVYGITYSEWKANHQLPVSDEKLAAFKAQRSQRESKS